MSMKPGATTMPARVDGALRRGVRQPSDRRDPPGANPDVGRIPGRAGAVDDVPVADHDVERLGSESAGKDKGER